MSRKRNISVYNRESFYKFPKYLIQDPAYDTLSNVSKLAYMFLHDRHDLSVNNNWLDKNGDIYFIMTREELGKLLRVTKKTAVRIMCELKKFGLLTETRQGFGKPNLLYLLDPDEPRLNEGAESDKTQSNKGAESDKTQSNSGVTQRCKNDTSQRCKNDTSQRCKNDTSQRCKNYTSYYNNKTDNNINKTERVRLSAVHTHAEKSYGEFGTIKLTLNHYEALAKEHSQETVNEYIKRIDEHQASTGKLYKNIVATIKKWIRQDEAKQKPQTANVNRFVNFKQRNNDYSNLDQLEREYQAQKLKGS